LSKNTKLNLGYTGNLKCRNINFDCAKYCGALNRVRLNVGEWVQFLNEVGGGEILKLFKDGRYLIKDEDGFENTYSASDLVIPFLAENDMEEPPSMDNEVITPKEIVGLEIFEGVSVGNIVRPVDETGEGYVKSISPKGICTVAMDYGLTIDYRRDEIVVVSIGLDDKMADIKESPEELIKPDDIIKRRPLPVKSKKEEFWEVDLHVHEITEETNFMGNDQLLRIQLDHFEMKLEEAIRKKVRKVIFIHGRGKGKLKDEIRFILKRYPNCEFHDGNFQRYGQGATEVLIWNK